MPLRDERARPRAHRRGRRGHGSRCTWSWSSASTTARSCRGCGRRDGGICGDRRAGRAAAAHAGRRCAGEDLTTVAEFTVAAGERVPFVLTWHPSHEPAPPAVDAGGASADTDAWWREWSRPLHVRRRVARAVVRVADHAQGADLRADRRHRRRADDVAARAARRRAQLGLPLLLAARRHLHALRAACSAGYSDEARAWRDWLLRAVAGEPGRLQIMYGLAGERRLTELELDWLPGYEGSRRCASATPPRSQFQLDVYGEVLDALHQARECGARRPTRGAWQLQRALLDFLERRLATSPTRASGRCAARGGTSPTRR